jgi:putative ABC transport system ATP-binding protein
MADLLYAVALTKRYESSNVLVEALRGIDFALRRGEFVTIMGPSGSGKSTLLHLLGGLDVPSSGEVIFDGMHLTQLSETQLAKIRRRQFGFVFQSFNLLPTLTAAENIGLPLLIDTERMQDKEGRIAELLDLTGLGDRAGHYPDQLSGGEQQRVAIARALLLHPAVIFADEPTGNLDSVSGEVIMRLLRSACDKNGQTVMMVTHNPEAAAVADRTIHLRDGLIEYDQQGHGVRQK